jgi:hypothetical protein
VDLDFKREMPPGGVEIDTVPDPNSATDGFVIMTIPPSQLAPHMFENRYPARSGADCRAAQHRRRPTVIGGPPSQGFCRAGGLGPGIGWFGEAVEQRLALGELLQ